MATVFENEYEKWLNDEGQVLRNPKDKKANAEYEANMENLRMMLDNSGQGDPIKTSKDLA